MIGQMFYLLVTNSQMDSMLFVIPECWLSVGLRDIQVLEVHVSADVAILETLFSRILYKYTLVVQVHE